VAKTLEVEREDAENLSRGYFSLSREEQQKIERNRILDKDLRYEELLELTVKNLVKISTCGRLYRTVHGFKPIKGLQLLLYPTK